ncbi:MAG: response regulator [Acidobacteriota bacterium]
MHDIPMRIVVVDDDMFTAELTGMALEAAGYEVVIAEGGFDALEKISENGPVGAVVSDMNMPFMSGVELFEELGRQQFAAPFILLTGEDARTLTAAHPGIEAVLPKDERFQEALPELLDALLGR